MVALSRAFRRARRRGGPAPEPAAPPSPERDALVDIAPGDPLLDHLRRAHGPVDVDALDLDSPALRALRSDGITLIVPLVSQGELIGALNLGPRRSEQAYSADDRKLLGHLATQVAPALRVGQLVRQRQAEAATRERVEHELEVARLIQRHFLPRELPDVPGWEVAAHYRPAREVGGDFYDVIPLADGRIGFVVGDVTDKGVPAALVMSATRSVLRSTAQRLIEPGAVLEQVNDHLCPDMPERMFVTCLYAVLDPRSGRLRFANAGHDLPYRKRGREVEELRARGMPLGLLPGMAYEEREVQLAPGDCLVLHSDGIVEAHDPQRAMFGFPRLQATVAAAPAGHALIDHVLGVLERFTGPDAEQEDDITMVTLERATVLDEFEVPSEPGSEREAIARVERAVRPLTLAPSRLERLKTAVGEATMNATEHGNAFRTDHPVAVRVLHASDRLRVQVTDCGEAELPRHEPPDLEAKLAGRQSPRGWGMFLINELVDDVRVRRGAAGRTLELMLRLEGGDDGDT